jgi:hypothetical protein
MRTLKLILIIFATVLLLNSCKKDENGNYITYYNNKKAVGWLFYKFGNDSIVPIANLKFKSYCSGGTGGDLFGVFLTHTDYGYTDNDGKFEFKLAKKINQYK